MFQLKNIVLALILFVFFYSSVHAFEIAVMASDSVAVQECHPAAVGTTGSDSLRRESFLCQ